MIQQIPICLAVKTANVDGYFNSNHYFKDAPVKICFSLRNFDATPTL
ncbi:membrane protein putative [Lactobacillus phage PM411]|nr:membrane protein putative [Lactobacillus phage PM411]